MQISIYTDGASRGNPGSAAAAFVVYDDTNQLIFKCAKFLGHKTNNEAEYMGLINALDWVKQNQDVQNISTVIVYSDSQLLVRQTQGFYKVKASHLKALHQMVVRLLSQIDIPISFVHLLRDGNQIADELANQSLDLLSDV